MRSAPVLVVLCLAACMTDRRPVHPYRLEGFPGAPIEGDLFPLRAGTRWVFRDRLADDKALELSLRREGEGFVLEGSRQGGASVALEGGFLSIRYEGEEVDRPLKLEGKVGDSWEAAGARYTVFGYDRIEVLGEKRRALVTAAERGGTRDLYWFVDGMGWVRMRTERQGRVLRDAVLAAHDAGVAN